MFNVLQILQATFFPLSGCILGLALGCASSAALQLEISPLINRTEEWLVNLTHHVGQACHSEPNLP